MKLRSRIVKRRKDVKQVVNNFPRSFFKDLIDNGLEQRIDDSKFLHFRLDLQEFVKGSIVLVKGEIGGGTQSRLG